MTDINYIEQEQVTIFFTTLVIITKIIV